MCAFGGGCQKHRSREGLICYVFTKPHPNGMGGHEAHGDIPAVVNDNLGHAPGKKKIRHPIGNGSRNGCHGGQVRISDGMNTFQHFSAQRFFQPRGFIFIRFSKFFLQPRHPLQAAKGFLSGQKVHIHLGNLSHKGRNQKPHGAPFGHDRSLFQAMNDPIL